MSQMQNIQWYPGHMTKTRRQIEGCLKLIDAVAEIVDARLPLSSRNPDLPKMTNSKPRLILLNKCDIADKKATDMWVDYFKKQGIIALPIDAKNSTGMNSFVPAVRELLKEKLKKLNEKGMGNRPLRVMVCGIPNVGKSSFINKLVGNTKAKVEDRPGVTRGNQWFTVKGKIELLDTPGVLWPKFDDQQVAQKLAFTGAIKDNVLDVESLCCKLIEFLVQDYRENIISRYKLEYSIDDLQPYEILELIAKKRGMLISKGEVDYERAAIMFIDEFRAGKLGKITLELPERC